MGREKISTMSKGEIQWQIKVLKSLFLEMEVGGK